MIGFLILQVLFDAVLLAGGILLFHYFYNQLRQKKEEADLLKSLQVQEIEEKLRELLTTLKKLGKEISEDIQNQFQTAEEKIEGLKKAVSRLEKDLNKAEALAEKIQEEKDHLEGKLKVIQTSKRKAQRIFLNRGVPENRITPLNEKTFPSEEEKNINPEPFLGGGQAVGFSSEVIREIYRLADESNALNEIVRKTKLTPAEVQLILNLRGNRFTTPN